jgi:hypothetical protein
MALLSVVERQLPFADIVAREWKQFSRVSFANR